MTKALKIEPNGHVSLINLQEGQINPIVGGYFEGHQLDGTSFVYINEDGKSLELPVNIVATKLMNHYRKGFAAYDYIVGTMLVVGTINPDTNKSDGDSHDVPAEVSRTALVFATKFTDNTSDT